MGGIAMNTVPQKPEEKGERKETKLTRETSLKGTFVSVMLLGAFLAVTWAAVFILFINRQ
jgi:hypothetical protein